MAKAKVLLWLVLFSSLEQASGLSDERPCGDNEFEDFSQRIGDWLVARHSTPVKETEERNFEVTKPLEDVNKRRKAFQWFFPLIDTDTKNGQMSRSEFLRAFTALQTSDEMACFNRFQEECYKKSEALTLPMFEGCFGIQTDESCPPYSPVLNAILSGDGSNSYHISCTEGYLLSGPSSRECSKDGTWTGTEPSCKVVDCGSLVEIKNGRVDVNETIFKSTGSYRCEEGFLLQGPHKRRCLSDRTWSGFTPKCIDPCYPNPCYNGGQCEKNKENCKNSPDFTKGFCCNCTGNFTGSFCDQERGCSLSPCFPGVQCTESGSNFRCGACPEGLKGNGIDCRSKTGADTLTVIVSDITSEQPIINANVRILLFNESGATTEYFNENSLSNVTVNAPFNSSLIITASASGYLSSSLLFRSSVENGSAVVIFLRKKAAKTKFIYQSDAESFTLQFNSSEKSPSYSLTIPPNSLNVADETEIEIVFTGIDPAESLVGIPQLIALDNDSSPVYLNSLGLAEVSIKNAATQKDMELSAPLLLSIGLNPQLDVSVGEEVPAWYYNETSGVWVREGSGIVEERNGGLVWEYNASHFSWWNADRPWTDTSCVDVTLKYFDEVPVVDVEVSLRGVPDSFLYSVSGRTDERGRKCFNFKRGGRAIIEVFGEEKRFYAGKQEIVGTSDPSTCPGTQDWLGNSGGKCSVEMISCDCSCLEDMEDQSLTKIVFHPRRGDAVLNFETALIMSKCVRKRFLTGIKTYTFESENLYFYVDEFSNELKLKSNFPESSYEGDNNLLVQLTMEDKNTEELSCFCGSTTIDIDVQIQLLENPGDTFEVNIPWELSETGMVKDGHDGSQRQYKSNGILHGSPWSVVNNGKVLTFKFENSNTCEGENDKIQTGSAAGAFSLSTPSFLYIELQGVVEHQSGGFEKLTVKIDGNSLLNAESVSNSKGCEMGPPVADVEFPLRVSLTTGMHQIDVSVTSVDAAYHKEAQYVVSFLFSRSE